MNRIFIALTLITVLSLNLGSCESASDDQPVNLEIRHIPNPVSAVLITDAEKGTTSYKWIFRTEVINTTSIPLKIVSFTCFSLSSNGWVNNNIGGNAYTNDDFTRWYDSGDDIHEGWILPGQRAADNSNWATSMWQVSGRCKWNYVAVDSLGNEYSGEGEVHLLPFYEEKDYWKGTGSSELIAIEGTISDSEEKPLDYVQIRIVPFWRFWSDPYDVALADREGNFMVRAARPGLYSLYAYSPGYGVIDRAIPLADGNRDIAISLIMRPVDEQSEVVLDDSGKYLETVWAIERMMRSERDSSIATYREYSRTHKDLSGYSYDWSMPESTLVDLVEHDSEEAVRKFAALLLAEVMYYSGIHDTEKLESLFNVLPPDSPYWGGLPQLSSWLCIRQKDDFKEDWLMRFLNENPDRVVRAYAIWNMTILMDNKGDYEKATEYYESALSEYSDINEIRPLMRMMDPNKKIKKGKDIPDFQVRTIDNPRDITRETLRGKYCLIHFWATWCGPCKPDMKYLHEAYERFKDSDFCILSISIDNDIEKVKSYRRELWPLPWDNAIEIKGTDSVLWKKFEVTGVPKMVLVGPEGKIIEVGSSLRGDKLVPFLEKCINKDK